jgi:hypothetical protein
MSATSLDWTVHEAREVCRSSRGYGSVSAFCGWGDSGSGDREPNVAANTLSAPARQTRLSHRHYLNAQRTNSPKFPFSCGETQFVHVGIEGEKGVLLARCLD